MTLFLYLLRRLVAATTAAILGLGFVVIPPLILAALARLGGVGLRVFLGYLPFQIMELGPYLAPTAFFLAVTATFSKLAARGEWLAIQMTGRHPIRTLLPGLVLAGPLALVSGWYLSGFMPGMRLAQENIKRSAALHVLEGLLPGRTTIEIGDFSIVCKGRHDNVFEDVVVRLPALEGGESRRIVADSATISIEKNVLHIQFAGAQVDSDRFRNRNETPRVSVPIDDLLRIKRASPNRPKYQSSAEIRRALAADEIVPEKVSAFRYEIHARNALAACYLVFLLLGIPAGLRLRSESLVGVVGVTALSVCLYYVFSLRFGEVLSVSLGIPVWLGAWSGDLLVVLTATVLFLVWNNGKERLC